MTIRVVKDDLKEVVKGLGPQGFLERLNKGLSTKEGPSKIRPEDISILELWNACTNNAPIGTARGAEDDFEHFDEAEIKEDIGGMGSTLFAKATGSIINMKVRDAYDLTPGVGDRLVTTVPSNLKTETIVGFTPTDSVSEVRELEEYPQTGMQELYFTVANKKYGVIIAVSEETIKFDQTNQILTRCQRIGEKARLFKEKTIVEGVIGPTIDSSTSAVFKPFGTAAVPYKSSARTTLAQGGAGGANAATGHADINHASLQAISTLIAKQYDEGGSTQYVNITMQGWILLCPWELNDEAWEVTNTAKTPFSGDNAENYWMQFRFVPVWSPIFGSTTTQWLLGDFKKDFVWTEVWPLQVQRLAKGSETEFTRDVVAAFKVRLMGGIGQTDYRHCYKCS